MCAQEAAKSLQPVPNHSVTFINIKKHIHTDVNSEVGIAQVQPSRCNTLQVHNNSKVMEDNQLFQDILSTP